MAIMIYLIGGPPRSGKSTLAHKLAKRLRCPEISVDWLRSVILPYLNGEDKTAIEDILFQHKNDPAKNSGIDEAAILWPAVKGFIEDKVRWQGDFVLDGIHLLPGYLGTISDELKPNIRAVFLVKTDTDKILAGFNRVRVRKNDWLLKRHWDDKAYLREIAGHIATRGLYFEEEARKHGFTVVK